MTKQYFIELAEYHVWANGMVCDWLDKISDDQWKQPVVSSFPSIYDTVLHVTAAENVWVQRLKKYTEFENLTKTFNGSKDELVKKWKEVSLNFKQFIENFPENSIDEKFAFKNILGIPHNQYYWQLFMHVVNHSTYHRGQLVTMLRQVGYNDLGSIDITTYFRTVTKAPVGSEALEQKDNN
jgi:uncharacterized damage-inducible protein DinB